MGYAPTTLSASGEFLNFTLERKLFRLARSIRYAKNNPIWPYLGQHQVNKSTTRFTVDAYPRV